MDKDEQHHKGNLADALPGVLQAYFEELGLCLGSQAHARAMDAHFGDQQSHFGGMEVHTGDVEVRSGAMETHAGAMKTIPGGVAWRLVLELLRFIYSLQTLLWRMKAHFEAMECAAL